MNSKQRLRSRFILILIAIGAALLAVSLYFTEIVQGQSYAAKAERQYVKPAASQFDRGTIFFSAKDGTRIAAATLGTGSLVFVNPALLTQPDQAYDALSQFIKLDKSQFMAKAAKTNDHYEVIAEQVPNDIALTIKNSQIAGVGILPESWRSYPGGTLAAKVLGLIGENASSSSIMGRYGLERWYDNILSRPAVGSSADVFAQLFGGLSSVFRADNSRQGDVVTTIEPTVQRYLEKILSDTENTWHSDELGGIIIDPATGEISAMASLPTYDPNNTSGISDARVFSDPLVEHVYEMGSIMKPLTMAMALDTGAVQPDTTYDDTGYMIINGRRIANYDGRARGVIPMQQILSQSLNVGAATIALKVEHDIGPGTMYKYFSSYGLGDKTGIDEPNEAAGLINNLKPGGNTRDINIATAAYGQGIAVSPIEIARGLSIIANGGYLVTPHVAKEIDYNDGTVERLNYPKKGPVLSKKTTDEVTDMLVKVVDDVMAKAHSGMYAKNYSIAAKTGTAQIPDHVNGGYYSGRYLHSFFGYFPAYNPRFLVFLYQVYPKGAEYASETLTNPFIDLEKFLIDYYNIPPDR